MKRETKAALEEQLKLAREQHAALVERLELAEKSQEDTIKTAMEGEKELRQLKRDLEDHRLNLAYVKGQRMALLEAIRRAANGVVLFQSDINRLRLRLCKLIKESEREEVKFIAAGFRGVLSDIDERASEVVRDADMAMRAQPDDEPARIATVAAPEAASKATEGVS